MSRRIEVHDQAEAALALVQCGDMGADTGNLVSANAPARSESLPVAPALQVHQASQGGPHHRDSGGRRDDQTGALVSSDPVSYACAGVKRLLRPWRQSLRGCVPRRASLATCCCLLPIDHGMGIRIVPQHDRDRIMQRGFVHGSRCGGASVQGLTRVYWSADIAHVWDERVPLAERLEKASAPAAWPQLGRRAIVPGRDLRERTPCLLLMSRRWSACLSTRRVERIACERLTYGCVRH
jgi:hypothetical protein